MPGNNDFQALHDLRARLEAAENSGDSAYIGSVMAEDIAIMVPNEPDPRKGRPPAPASSATFSSTSTPRSTARFVYVSDEVSVHGDLAFDRGRFSFTVTRKDDGTVTHAVG